MDRRNFLKSIGATALLPAIPLPASALATPMPAAAGAAAFSSNTYQWAEMIVRAHNKCNLGLLQRSLHIDATAASALKDALVKNGIVTAQANAYGIHTATKPLYEGAFMSVSETAEKITETAEKVSELLEDENEEVEPIDTLELETEQLTDEEADDKTDEDPLQSDLSEADVHPKDEADAEPSTQS